MNIYDYYITPSEYEIALSNGIGKTTLETRIRDLLWDKQRAITEKPADISKGYAEYKWKAINNGVSGHNFYMRVLRGWSLEEATQPKKQIGKEFLDKQRIKSKNKTRKYPSWVYENLEKYGIKQPTFWHRVNNLKWSMEEASTTPPLAKGTYRPGIERSTLDNIMR